MSLELGCPISGIKQKLMVTRNISDHKEEKNKRNERRPEASLRAQTPGTLNFSMKNAEARALLDSRRSVFIRKPTKRC